MHGCLEQQRQSKKAMCFKSAALLLSNFDRACELSSLDNVVNAFILLRGLQCVARRGYRSES